MLLLWMSSNNTPADQVHFRTMNSSTVSDCIKFLQINIQHNKTVTGLICKQTADLNHALVLIQEPWTNKNKILGLCARGTSLFHYCCSENNPRTCVITKGLQSYYLPQYSNKDRTAVCVNIKPPKSSDLSLWHQFTCLSMRFLH